MKQKKLKIPVERTYETEITYTCPVRGSVTQNIEVKVYRRVDDHYRVDQEWEEFLRQEGVIDVEPEEF